MQQLERALSWLSVIARGSGEEAEGGPDDTELSGVFAELTSRRARPLSRQPLLQ